MKFVCSVCGYVHEGDTPPAECPVCHAPADKFKEQAQLFLHEPVEVEKITLEK